MYIATFIWKFSNLVRLNYEYIHSEVELYSYYITFVASKMMKTKIKREVAGNPFPFVCPCPSLPPPPFLAPGTKAKLGHNWGYVLCFRNKWLKLFFTFHCLFFRSVNATLIAVFSAMHQPSLRRHLHRFPLLCHHQENDPSLGRKWWLFDSKLKVDVYATENWTMY